LHDRQRANDQDHVMNLQQSTVRYDPLSQAFHWLTAVAVIVAFILGPGGFGRLMNEGVDPASRSDIVWHETLGVLILLLTVLRLVWVWRRPGRARLQNPGWMERTASLMHLVLWALLVALPATAFLSLGSEAHPLTLLGGLRINEMPLIADSALAELADWGDLHQFIGDALISLAGLHAAAAIYHHFVLKDGVLAAMWPWGRPR
jgi:cytochrome b561